MAPKALSAEFWRTKTLAQMSTAEWEALCDGCGKCCLHKLLAAAESEPDEESAESDDDAWMHAGEELHYTDVRCQYLDPATARCGCYAERLARVENCVNITLADLPNIHFMPSTCAYRRLHEGRGLPLWHPLRHGGSRVAMQAAKQDVGSYATVSECDVAEEDYELRIVTWPL